MRIGSSISIYNILKEKEKTYKKNFRRKSPEYRLLEKPIDKGSTFIFNRSIMKTRILSILTLILALGTISLCFRNYQLRLRSSQQRVVTKIDTIYLEKPFETTSYKWVSSPAKITVYTKGLVKDTHSTQKKDSVVQFKLNKTSLDLTLYNVLDSTVHTDTYQLDLNKYKYTFSNGIITQKRTYNLRFSPYLQAKIRPINQFFDLSGGISLKSNHFTYGLGLVIGYYPKLSNKLHKDIEVMVNYNF